MTNPFDQGSNGPGPFGGTTPPTAPRATAASASTPSGLGAGLAATGDGERVIERQNLDGRLRDMKKASEGMRIARERLATLVGTGTAADDKVKVTWAAATGLDQLTIDPRAMRMPSEDLARAVKQAITAAMADLRRQTAEVMKEELGTVPGDTAAKIEEMREAFDSEMNEITARIDQARGVMESALLR